MYVLDICAIEVTGTALEEVEYGYIITDDSSSIILPNISLKFTVIANLLSASSITLSTLVFEIMSLEVLAIWSHLVEEVR